MLLAGLEHLDDRYLKAVGYATKSKKGGGKLPKMVLIGDIVGDDQDAVARAAAEVVRIANSRDGEGFTAVSAEARKKFWLDRKRTAAISRHTNAFKINEDVVIPLPRMAEYTDGIERINIELSLRNKLALCDALRDFLARGDLPLNKQGDAQGIGADVMLGDRVAQAQALVAEVRALWQGWLDGVEALFPQLQDHSLRASWKSQLRQPLADIFTGAAFEPIVQETGAIHQRVLKGRVWVALHMHAGDGNVHTNIPVNSDDYEMLQTAHEAVARIMQLARSLDGVISGEHGIGITKLEFLTPEELAPFAEYKRRVDPEGRFNWGKLLRNQELLAHYPQGQNADIAQKHSRTSLRYADLTNAYTPSFGLMGYESLIMQQSDIGAIVASVKDCLRCGKCKPVCATHVPRANLLYSPRNKILATSLLAEAFLYEEQTRRGVSSHHWQEFEDVADHCTICHKCFNPCPVKIDFGDVTMAMRNLLVKMDKKSWRPGNKLAMAMLNATRPRRPSTCCAPAWSTSASGAAPGRRRAEGRGQAAGDAPAGHRGHGADQGAGDPLRQQEAARRPADQDGARAAGHPGQGLRPHHPQPATSADSEAVFYFPGCGSERLFSQVGLATQAMLWHAGVQTVLPPGYLCCGYPQRGNGQFRTRPRR